MSTIWMGIDPRPEATRILVMAGTTETLLKARLRPSPSSRLALRGLCQAIALWQGQKVHAALVAGPSGSSSDISLFRDSWNEVGDVLFGLEIVERLRRPRTVDTLGGMGPFADLRQVLLFEVAR